MPALPKNVPKKIVLLGATGSIGENTLRVIRQHPDKLQLVGIASRQRYQELAAIAKEFNVEHVALFDEEAALAAKQSGLFQHPQTILAGLDGLIELATLDAADLIVTAVVGTLSLKPTLAAIERGKDIALASKEILVLAGQFVMQAARQHKVNILPLDSEHNAIFQCLQGEYPAAVEKLILTASGGPFRDYTAVQMQTISREDALKHPNWSMGPKITIDSSTMANKGLELIEAHWLFGQKPENLQVVIHPQSIVHSMVQYVDGSIIAQLSPPSMTFAIQHSLLYPERAAGVDATVDFSQWINLEFRPPDFSRFPCLQHALDAMQASGIAPAIFNASNEIAVDAFLHNRIGYLEIPKIIGHCLTHIPHREPKNLEDVLAADQEARRIAQECTKHINVSS